MKLLLSLLSCGAPFLLVVQIFFLFSCSAPPSKSSVVDDVTVRLIRKSTQSYLDRYFESFDYHHLTTIKSPALQVSLKSHSDAEWRPKIQACMILGQGRMKDFRKAYLEESYEASLRLDVREDDALRLFFVGDLLTCLENIDTAVSQSVIKASRSKGKRGYLSISEMNRIFNRTAASPINFSAGQARTLKSVANSYVASPDAAGKSERLQYYQAFLSVISFSFLEGRKGIYNCTALLVVILGVATVAPRAMQQKRKTELVEAILQLADTDGMRKKMKKQKKK